MAGDAEKKVKNNSLNPDQLMLAGRSPGRT